MTRSSILQGMKSVRKALRDGDLSKDNYGRLSCVDCDTTLKSRNDPSEIGTVRLCPNCESEWQEL